MTRDQIIHDLRAINEYFLEQSEGCAPVCLEEAIKLIEEERPTGEWESLGFVNMKYAWCRCSNCHKTTKIYKDSSNEFCCIADIRKKAVACLYCGAKMKGGNND